jgi:hypothetical protein
MFANSQACWGTPFMPAWTAEAGRALIPGQLGLHHEVLSQKYQGNSNLRGTYQIFEQMELFKYKSTCLAISTPPPTHTHTQPIIEKIQIPKVLSMTLELF